MAAEYCHLGIPPSTVIELGNFDHNHHLTFVDSCTYYQIFNMNSQVPFPMSCAPNQERLQLQSEDTTKGAPLPTERNTTQQIPHVPGDPAVSLCHADVHTHLLKHFDTPLLDELYDKLWLVSRRSVTTIDPLHSQMVKGRSIVPTEDPSLHLVWNRSNVYIKPVPTFLFNYEFWETYLQNYNRDQTCNSTHDRASASDRSVAIGFLRSYAFLVPNRLDFALAREMHLIPAEIDWIEWSKFISHFRHIQDNLVAKRYHYGQLRLSRLHWVVRISCPEQASTRWFYAIPYWSITEFVAQATLPLLFVFASVSVCLSSMQVALSVPVDDLWYIASNETALRGLSRVFWVFSVAVVLLGGIVWVLFLGIPLIVLIWQVFWGFQNREKGRRLLSSPA